MMYGEFIKVDGEMTEEKLEEAKEILLDKICNGIRKIAKENSEQFFIVKDFSESDSIFKGDYFTVGCKFELPTISSEEGGNENE